MLEAWHNGVLLYQKPLQEKVRAWNACREQKSIIFLLDPVDEDVDGDIIHVLTLDEVCTNVYDSRLSSGFDQMQKDMLVNINEKKIRDWTGLCA